MITIALALVSFITGPSLDLADRPLVIALVKAESRVDLSVVASAKSADEATKWAKDLGWFASSLDAGVIVVDRELLDFAAIYGIAEVVALCEKAGSDGIFRMADLTPSSRAALRNALIRTNIGWWPLYERDDLTLSVQPSAEIRLKSGTGSHTVYVEVPTVRSAIPRYTEDWLAPPGTIQPKADSVGRRASGSELPESFSVRLFNSVDDSGWQVVSSAIESVKASYANLRATHDQAVRSLVGEGLGAGEADRLLSSRSLGDMPRRMGDRLVNEVQARRSQFGVPEGSDTRAWLSNVEISSVKVRLFAEFQYVDSVGNTVIVSVGLPRW